jgi:hypothetical protein
MGMVHRAAATQGGQWVEPSPALRRAFRDLGWTVRINWESQRVGSWPVVKPEPKYHGVVHLKPQAGEPSTDAVYLDGSIKRKGGAALVQPSTGKVELREVETPRSSTHCEMEAILLIETCDTSHALSDSLCALQYIKGWGFWTHARMLACPDRAEVRRFLHQWEGALLPPVLEKVLAHDEPALLAGKPKTVGNDQADHWAKKATECGVAVTSLHRAFADPVMILDNTGQWILSAATQLHGVWWERNLTQVADRRLWFNLLYPTGMKFDWKVSCLIFQRPLVSRNSFVYPVGQLAITWVGRV